MSSNELRELLADVDFTSIQMFPDAPGAMTHRMNCGNIAAGVPIFALVKNMVPALPAPATAADREDAIRLSR